MFKSGAVLFMLTCLSVSTSSAQDSENFGFMPVPQQIDLSQQKMTLQSSASLSYSPGVSKDFAEMAAVMLRNSTGWEIPIAKRGTISFRLTNDHNVNPEKYELVINRRNVVIKASAQQGLFYGLQTLLQLLPPEPTSKSQLQLPTGNIIDYPKFEWRGILVDVSRRFQTKETIKKLLDGMAACKLNVFHWHLTDDPGWRIEIKKYPLLTKKSKQFYTQDDIREIVKYAELRAIMIVPEIDLPGHSSAATKAYPKLRCREPNGKKSRRGNYCPSEEFSYEFLGNVMEEVAELFPSPYIHLGADEVGTGRWRKCPDCKAFMKKHNMEKTHTLEAHFVQTVSKKVRELGKQVITWDEAFNTHSHPEQVIMSWRGAEPGMKAAEKGHKVVFTPVSALYLDRTNSRSKHQRRGYSVNTVNLNLPYFFEPTSPLLSDKAKKNVLGAQGSVWGEKIRSSSHVLQMAMMRGCALAEATWSGPEKRNWNSFLKRADIHRKRLDALGVDYFWEPMSTPIEIAKLTPEDIEASKGTFSVDVSKYVKGNGLYEFTCHRYSGDGTYKVTSASMLENQKVIATDTHKHTVTIDPRKPNQFYHLMVHNFDENAEYTLKVKFSTEKSKNFTAAIMLIPPLPEGEYSNWAQPKAKTNGHKYKKPE